LAAATLEQREAEVDFKVGQAFAQRGLTFAQLPGTCRDWAVLYCRDKRHQRIL